MNNIMDYSREMNNQVKEYVDRVINAEKQVKLLEDLEQRQEEGYHRLTAENKQLITVVNNLKEQISTLEESAKNKQEYISELESKTISLEEELKSIKEMQERNKWYKFRLK